MKAHLLCPDADFDFTAELPPGYQDLIHDLELDTLLTAMAGTTSSCVMCRPGCC